MPIDNIVLDGAGPWPDCGDACAPFDETIHRKDEPSGADYGAKMENVEVRNVTVRNTEAVWAYLDGTISGPVGSSVTCDGGDPTPVEATRKAAHATRSSVETQGAATHPAREAVETDRAAGHSVRETGRRPARSDTPRRARMYRALPPPRLRERCLPVLRWSALVSVLGDAERLYGSA